METESLYRLQKKDSEKLVRLLTECFEHDPLYCKLIPQKELRRRILPEIMSCDSDEMFENCEIYADSPEVNGIIVVSDETAPWNPVRYYWTEFFCWLKTARCLVRDDPSLHTLMNFIRGKKYLDEGWTEELASERRMHIVYFAVRPSMRGCGIAGNLMRSALDYADRNRLLTSLETHNARNVGMYEHYGFRMFKTLEESLQLKQYCMVR